MKKLLVLMFCLSAFTFCFAAENPCTVKIGEHKAVTPVERTTSDWWMPRHQGVLEREKQGNVDILMIGDSITHGWDGVGKPVWDQYYAKRNAVNMGFSGDRTEHVLWRLEHGEVNNINPKLAVLMIGTNNSGGNDYTSEQIADGVKAIVCELRTRLPNTKVLILSIFPRSDSSNQPAKDSQSVALNPQWKKNNAANKLIKKIADNKTIYYLDINKKFLNKKGELSRDVMPDFLHPNEKGYQIWAKAMEPMIVKLTGEKKK
ncbi:MAG: platelet-activating factor acetylhydrolase IB subunit [Phycisphaerales bacterium]